MVAHIQHTQRNFTKDRRPRKGGSESQVTPQMGYGNFKFSNRRRFTIELEHFPLWKPQNQLNIIT